jgi:hypothetical protein
MPVLLGRDYNMRDALVRGFSVQIILWLRRKKLSSVSEREVEISLVRKEYRQECLCY